MSLANGSHDVILHEIFMMFINIHNWKIHKYSYPKIVTTTANMGFLGS